MITKNLVKKKLTKKNWHWPGVSLLLILCSSILQLGCNNSDTPQSKSVGPNSFKVKEVVKEKPSYSLSDDQTAYLWDLEHSGNVLGKHGFKPLIKAIVENDRTRIVEILGEPDCTLVDSTEDSKTTYTTPAVQLTRETGEQKRSLTVAEIADWWLEKRAMFSVDSAPKIRFDVKRISPPKEDEFWTVESICRMWGEATDGGPLEIVLAIHFRTEAIKEDRLALGSWVHNLDITQVDIGHSKTPLFAEVPIEKMRIDPASFHDNWTNSLKKINTGGIFSCDYNRDGITDFFVTDIKEDAGKMYTGVPGGKFNDETFFLKLEMGKNARIAVFADLDNDGWEDVFFPDVSRVFKNINGESFAPFTGETNLPLMLDPINSDKTLQRLSGVFPADYDLDGDIDLYITRSVEPVGSWLESLQPNLAHNQLLRNEGNWEFRDVTARTGTDGGGRSAFSAVWTDVNNDRYPDLYIINEFGNGTLMVNDAGKGFKEQKLFPEQNDFGSMGLSCGDYNNDGHIDFYVSNMYSKAGSRIMGNMVDGTYPDEVQNRLRSMVAGGELYQNNGDLKFEPVGKDFQVHAAGWAWGSSMTDFNNDGLLDLYVTAGFISRDRSEPDG